MQVEFAVTLGRQSKNTQRAGQGDSASIRTVCRNNTADDSSTSSGLCIDWRSICWIWRARAICIDTARARRWVRDGRTRDRIVTDLAVTVLLFSQFAVVRSRALLLLESAYLFSALMVAMHALAFPGAFTPAGLLGGLQTSPWLYVFWHAGLPVAVIAYALLKDRGDEDAVVVPPTTAVAVAAAAVAGLVIALTWSASQDFMPRLLDNAIMFGTLAHSITGLLALTCMVALGLLWARQRSILDLWLIVALCALLAELGSGPIKILVGWVIG